MGTPVNVRVLAVGTSRSACCSPSYEIVICTIVLAASWAGVESSCSACRATSYTVDTSIS